MNIEKPQEKGFTIYCKSACKNCVKVKTFLSEKNILFNAIDCDDYIIEDKEQFIVYIQAITNNKYKQFPIVFNDGIFIGEYLETLEYCNKMIDFNEEF